MNIGTEIEEGTCIPETTPVPSAPDEQEFPARVPAEEPEYEIVGS